MVSQNPMKVCFKKRGVMISNATGRYHKVEGLSKVFKKKRPIRRWGGERQGRDGSQTNRMAREALEEA